MENQLIQNNSNKEIHEIPQFKPTMKMQAFAKEWANPETGPTLTAVCLAAGVDKSMVYRWYKKKGFNEWLNSEVVAQMKTKHSFFMKVGMINSSRNFKFWNRMLEILYGYVPSSKVIAENTNTNIDKSFDPSKLTDEELAKLDELYMKGTSNTDDKQEQS